MKTTLATVILTTVLAGYASAVTTQQRINPLTSEIGRSVSAPENTAGYNYNIGSYGAHSQSNRRSAHL